MTNKELQEKIARLETELAEVKEKIAALPKRVDGGLFKPEYGQKYWHISGAGGVYKGWWHDYEVDHNRHSIGNSFPTEQAAEDVVRVLKLIQKARESQDGFVPDWEKPKQQKYTLMFRLGNIDIEGCFSINTAPTLGYWGDKSVCEQFIDENNDELRWFFTEYER